MKERIFDLNICNVYFPTAHVTLSHSPTRLPCMSNDPGLLSEQGWKRARVDPHVNCFISREDLTLDEYARRNVHLQLRRQWKETVGEPSGLRARYDRGSPPDFILLCGPRFSAPPSPSPTPPMRSMFAARLEPFVSTKGERQRYRNQVWRRFAFPSC